LLLTVLAVASSGHMPARLTASAAICPSIALQVVLLPVIAGAALNTAFPKQVTALGPLSALSAVVLIALICGSVMAQNAADVIAAGPKLLACVFALHAGG
jgi:BASS family bile acid:Na+ symporter